MRERTGRSWLRLVPCLLALLGLAGGYGLFRVLESGDRFVMVTVEESSTSAVVAWPLLAERLPDVFVDCSSSTVVTSRKQNLLGVRLGVYYSASSQGIEMKDSISFSRSGALSLDLDAPQSQMVAGIDGSPVEMVDSEARVIRGDLRVERTTRDGTVHFAYGDTRFALEPGQSWVEMLASTPDGVRRITVEGWETELQLCLDRGYPATRLAVTNRGFWPKAGVRP